MRRLLYLFSAMSRNISLLKSLFALPNKQGLLKSATLKFNNYSE